MTLQEFRDKANEIAEGYGLNKLSVTVIAGIFGHHNCQRIFYSCQVYDSDKRKIVKGEMYPNPESALESFSDILMINYKNYNDLVSDIEI